MRLEKQDRVTLAAEGGPRGWEEVVERSRSWEVFGVSVVKKMALPRSGPCWGGAGCTPCLHVHL